MHHLACNTASIADVTLASVAAIQDQILSIRDSKYVPSNDLDLILMAGIGVTLKRLRLNNAHFQAVQPPYLLPVTTGTVPGIRAPVIDLRQRPLRMLAAENIDPQVFQNVGGAEQEYVFSWFQPQFQAAPVGEPVLLRGTSTTAATANVWTDLSMTWDFDLPPGRYGIIGGAYYGATAFAFRVLLEGQTWRPGGLGTTLEGSLTNPVFFNGELGLWGSFNTISLPNIQILNSAAVAVHTIYLQVVRMA